MTETIYSTSTVDTTVSGTTTIDYWATYYPDPKTPSSMQMLHATRAVIVSASQQTPAPANDNSPAPTAANDNAAPTTTITSTGQ